MISCKFKEIKDDGTKIIVTGVGKSYPIVPVRCMAI